ncbi:hypothetical protein GOV12_00780, partial [Candidatus Pacearchaeota archaeon]|nr:hypothetical protein [Candidatus Pacearchaeota archaeon]
MLGGGHIFSNLGVGAFLTITVDEKNYLIGGRQIRPCIGDEVYVAPGGYVESKDSFNPLRALNREISEEVLVATKDNKLISIGKNGFQSYKEKLEYLEKLIDLESPGEFTQDNLQEPILLDRGLLLKKPRLYFNPRINSVKLMYSFHLTTDEIDLEDLEASFDFCEDSFNPDSNTVQSIHYQDKLLLIPLLRRNLKREVCRFQNGSLEPITEDEIQNLYLSGIFTLDEKGFSTQSRIKFLEYLKKSIK